jgi:hypothetical protein
MTCPDSTNLALKTKQAIACKLHYNFLLSDNKTASAELTKHPGHPKDSDPTVARGSAIARPQKNLTKQANNSIQTYPLIAHSLLPRATILASQELHALCEPCHFSEVQDPSLELGIQLH